MHTILIVSGDSSISGKTIQSLDRFASGVSVVGEANTIELAFVLTEKLAPDIVIADISPTGHDFLPYIRNVIAGEIRTHFILVGRFSDLRDARAELRSGICDYLLKPVSADEFFKSIKNACRAIERERVPEKIRQYVSQVNLSIGKNAVSKIKTRLEKEYNGDLKLSSFASDYYMNESYLSVLFRQETGINYSQYLTKLRLEKAMDLLAGTALSTAKIAKLIGYKDRNYFASVFSKKFGMTPAEYRRLLLDCH
jgi:two-component system response regulator YesN